MIEAAAGGAPLQGVEGLPGAPLVALHAHAERDHGDAEATGDEEIPLVAERRRAGRRGLGGEFGHHGRCLHRSEVLAGAMILSGGVSPNEQDSPTTFYYEPPLRDVPVFLAHGGQTDIYDAVVIQIEFDTMTETLADQLVADDHFTILCRHGVGHYFTQGVAVSGFQFLSAHSWKNTTSFWQENGLPGSFDSSCSIH